MLLLIRKIKHLLTYKFQPKKSTFDNFISLISRGIQVSTTRQNDQTQYHEVIKYYFSKYQTSQTNRTISQSIMLFVFCFWQKIRSKSCVRRFVLSFIFVIKTYLQSNQRNLSFCLQKFEDIRMKTERDIARVLDCSSFKIQHPSYSFPSGPGT